MFLVPIPQGESFTTLLDFLKSWIKGLFGGSLSYIIVVILIVSAVMSTYDYFAKPEWIRKNHYLTRAFTTTPLYLVSKIIGAVFAVMGGMIYVIIRHRGRVADLNMKQMLLMAAFSLYFGFASGGVDNAAHAGGLLCGFIAAVIVYHPRKIWKTVP